MPTPFTGCRGEAGMAIQPGFREPERAEMEKEEQ